jgi:ATP-dependent Lhr-like helicase
MAQDASGQIHFLGPPPPTSASALAALAEPVRHWFEQRFGQPTRAQCLAWPALAAGRQLLLCAPTGTGKTLAAFLPVVSRLLADSERGTVRCLYVAPLKALATDARKNLRRDLREIRHLAPCTIGVPRLALRTGDTSARLRRRIWSEPPDILLTTPESLAVLLSQPLASELFHSLRFVVIDEVHSLACSKRGADLALSLERLTDLAMRDVQRIGLSATCAPVTEAARFLVGSERDCTVAQVDDTAPLQLSLEPLDDGLSLMPQLLERLESELASNRTTLVFTHSRRLTERLAWALRRRYPTWEEEIAVHHSSLAAPRRRRVERLLKQGRLRAVVTSTSLELGIDMGTVDAVVLVHPPGGVVRLLQRVGRAGHGPSRPRRGLVLTASCSELLEAAVTNASTLPAQLEPGHTPEHPLDVLCQQLLGMAAQRPWLPDEAFALVRHAFPYRELQREDFDACLDYLSGRRSSGETWLPPRLRWESGAFQICDRRTTRILRRNLGTILTEEPRTVRLATSAVGELDQSFADRLEPGDRFLLDGRCLECRRIEGPDVLVEEVVGRPAVPRWSGEGWPLASELARRLYVLRVQAAEALREGSGVLIELLRRDYRLEEPALSALVMYLQSQETISEIPDAAVCLIEAVREEGFTGYYVHTPLNRAANDAVARVVVRRLARARGRTITSQVADLGFSVFTPNSVQLKPSDWEALLAVTGFDAHLDDAVAASPALRERFRRAALVGLMLLRRPLGAARRVGGPDWAERRLFDQVLAAEPDFVLLRQARREVRGEWAAATARAYLEELPGCTLRCRWLRSVSPFAQGWTQVVSGPIEAVESPVEVLQRLHDILTRDG